MICIVEIEKGSHFFWNTQQTHDSTCAYGNFPEAGKTQLIQCLLAQGLEVCLTVLHLDCSVSWLLDELKES